MDFYCSKACIDIDECSLSGSENAVCHNGECQNLRGGFRCDCFEGN